MKPVEFTCPRCAASTAEDFYGPCGTCREELRMAVSGEKRDIDATEYAPKVNVTANAVALKDD